MPQEKDLPSSVNRLISALTIAFVLGVLWTLVSRVTPAVSESGLQPGSAPGEGFRAPDFRLDLLGGGQVTLSQLRGKAVLVNFWATWCLPCRTEMPAIEKVYRSYKGLGLAVVGVNLTSQDSIPDVAGFVQELGITFPIALDRDGLVSNRYQVLGLPTTFFIDRQGVIRSVVVGGPMSEVLIQSRVESLLKEGQ